jgi:hypothetical protein
MCYNGKKCIFEYSFVLSLFFKTWEMLFLEFSIIAKYAGVFTVITVNVTVLHLYKVLQFAQYQIVIGKIRKPM